MGTLNDISTKIKCAFSDIVQRQPTLHRSCVPHVIHEPAIINGYRPTNQTWGYYVISLFQIHNETVNVWTHLIGFIMIWITMANYSEEFDYIENKHAGPILVFGITCLLSNFLSSLAHLLHAKSAYHHDILFTIDYVGATAYAFGTGIQAYYSNSNVDFYRAVEDWILLLLWLTTLINFVVLSAAKLMFHPLDQRKKYIQVGAMTVQAAITVSPFLPRYVVCYYNDECSFSSLSHLTTNSILFCLSAFFFGSHLPEKLLPGKFDIFGQGHQIFHICVNINQIKQFEAMRRDFRSGASGHCNPNIVNIMLTLASLLYCKFLMFFVMKHWIEKKYHTKQT